MVEQALPSFLKQKGIQGHGKVRVCPGVMESCVEVLLLSCFEGSKGQHSLRQYSLSSDIGIELN